MCVVWFELQFSIKKCSKFEFFSCLLLWMVFLFVNNIPTKEIIKKKLLFINQKFRKHSCIPNMTINWFPYVIDNIKQKIKKVPYSWNYPQFKSLRTHQMNSLQCEQNVGCLKNVAMNLCPLTLNYHKEYIVKSITNYWKKYYLMDTTTHSTATSIESGSFFEFSSRHSVCRCRTTALWNTLFWKRILLTIPM